MVSQCWAVVPAGGVGRRMKSSLPKQYLQLNGQTILAHTINRLAKVRGLLGIVVAVAENDEYWDELNFNLDIPLWRANAGQERCHSVLAGLNYLTKMTIPSDWVLVHDAARPCLRTSDVEKLMSEIAEHECGGILALPVRDTMKRADNDQMITTTVERTGLWHALTPQLFRINALTNALEQTMTENIIVTDEAQALEYMGKTAKLVEGHADNIKITHPQDLGIAELYLKRQEEETCA